MSGNVPLHKANGRLIHKANGRLLLGGGTSPWPPSPGDPNDGRPDQITISWTGGLAYDPFRSYDNFAPATPLVSGVGMVSSSAVMDHRLNGPGSGGLPNMGLDYYRLDFKEALVADPTVFGKGYKVLVSARLEPNAGFWQVYLSAWLRWVRNDDVDFGVGALALIADGVGPATTVDPRGAAFTINTFNVSEAYTVSGTLYTLTGTSTISSFTVS